MIKPWREIIVPHKDVAGGKYQQAEFAADLAQVLSGKAEPEYQDAHEFFSRTYLTEGMNLLLASALKRASGVNGEPVIQLKTAFGGGKTHTMLALYHLFSDKKIHSHSTIKDVMKFAKINSIPSARIAVLVGTAIDPAKPKTIPGFKHKINTFWGYMAYQLGKDEAFAYVAEADKKGVAPGTDTLVEMFSALGPCIIIIDELVAYARNIYGKDGLSCGTFDSLMTFMQNLTEAARRSKNCMVIASIPESNIEIGGEGGKAALEKIEHTFGRLDAVWKPVKATESFEIIRRRLFEPVKDEKAKEEVCKAFSDLYSRSNGDFPSECKEMAYLIRLREAYPVHPEVFDRLYQDWSTLEKFQRTRGVLRLMAATIHQLWISNDKSAMIMPGNIPLDTATVRNEMTRYLPDEWNGIVDSDVGGDRAEPKKVDESNHRFGAIGAARRIANTIFLGSAPSSKEQKNRGIENVRIMLGVVQPEENIATFKDALATLSQRLTYLYYQNDRYWYDSRPNLRKTVEDRAVRIDDGQVFAQITSKLHENREKGDFAGVHICPENEDVPDDDEARLVVISPKFTHKKSNLLSDARSKAMDILDKRGNSPRQYKNMLVFLAADEEIMLSLNDDMRRLMAWKSVIDDQEALNIDTHQKRQAEQNVVSLEKAVRNRINEMYIWLIVPTQDGTKPVTLDIKRITKGEGSLIARASRQLKSEELLITRWSPALLKNELDKWLWKNSDYINLKQLWNYLTSYPYLPRLRDSAVLIECIQEGLRSKDFFAYASDYDLSSKKFLGLEYGNPGASVAIDDRTVLIKKEIAAKQLELVETNIPKQTDSPKLHPSNDTLLSASDEEISDRKFKRYYGSVRLDPIRLSRDAGLVSDEIVQHLLELADADQIEVVLEIKANVSNGLPSKVVRIIIENGKTLKFITNNFEEE